MWLLPLLFFLLLYQSLLYVETVDRPGLLVDLVKIVADINVAVESGEFDTEVIVYRNFSIFYFILPR